MPKIITNDTNKQTLTFQNLDSTKTTSGGDFSNQSRKVQGDIDALESSRNKLVGLQGTAGNLSTQQAQEASQTVAQLKDQAATFQSDQAALLNLVGDGTQANQAVNASYQQGAQRINDALGAAGSLQSKGLASALGADGFNQVKNNAGDVVNSLNQAGKNNSFTNYAGAFNAGSVSNPFNQTNSTTAGSGTAAPTTGATSGPTTGGTSGPTTGGTSGPTTGGTSGPTTGGTSGPTTGGTSGPTTGGTSGPTAGGTSGPTAGGTTGGTSGPTTGGTSGPSTTGTSGPSTVGGATSSAALKVGDKAPSIKNVEDAIGAKWSPTLTLAVSNHFADASGKITNAPSSDNISSTIDQAFGGKSIPAAEKTSIVNNLTKVYSSAGGTSTASTAGSAGPTLVGNTGSSASSANSNWKKAGDKGPTLDALTNFGKTVGFEEAVPNIFTQLVSPNNGNLIKDASPTNFRKILDETVSTSKLPDATKADYAQLLSNLFRTAS